jgi:hypothetical protein
MIISNTVSAATQADGAQEITLGVNDSAMLHQMQVSTSATPAAGTLTVAIKTPGASAYANLTWTIDLTDLASQAIFQFTGFAEGIQFTPTGFDGDKTYTVDIISGKPGDF